MKTFVDRKQRTWTIDITVAAMKRIRSLAGVDLLDLSSGVLEKLMQNSIMLCDVIYAAVKPQADEQGISDVDFGEAMAGDVIEQATTALIDELVSFCPNPRDRANLGRIVTATNAVMEKARDLMEQEIKKIDLEEVLAATEREISGSSSANAPASSASIPGP